MSILQLDEKKRAPQITPKQLNVLRALVKRNQDGSYLDVKQLIAAIGSTEARGTMISTIRHLHAHGLVDEGDLVTRRGRRVRTYFATQTAVDIIRPSALNTGGKSVI